MFWKGVREGNIGELSRSNHLSQRQLIICFHGNKALEPYLELLWSGSLENIDFKGRSLK